MPENASESRGKGRMKSVMRLPPPALLAALYATLILLGAAALMLPFASVGGELDWSSALFMATSAVTVTGLVVVDPGTDLSGLGQAIIALLIQLGGLGLMTFTVLVLSSFGLPVGLSQKMYLQEDLGRTSLSELLDLVLIIFRVVLVAELAGFAILAFVFVPDFGWSHGLWQALFHSISAFNNAGFSLFPNSLVDYATDPIVNVTITALFIVGGLGFVVLSDIFRHNAWHLYTLHTKIMLVGTAGLIVFSVTTFGILEWHNPGTLGQHETTGDKLWVTWFQAVTTRTAGFNTTDTAAMTDASALMTITLMIIGGGTTSTAGGIKVTTFVVLLLATVAFFRRRTQLTAFGASISLDQVLKVMALLTISLFVIVTALFLLLATQNGPFLPMLFETTSAFGTVGLSQGVTGSLDDFGRAVICFLMFLGRVGPLTLGFFLAVSVAPRVRYPSSPIYLG